jgi:endoglucanase
VRLRGAAAAIGALLLLALLCTTAGAAVDPGLRVRGRSLIDGPGRGHVVRLLGVNRSGLEYACIQGWGFFQGPDPDQIDSAAMIAAMKSWDIDAVRVPLNEDCWLGLQAPPGRGGAPYRRIVARYVRALNRAGLYVILDLHWAGAGAGAKAVGQTPMADAAHAPAFWRSVASTFKHDHQLVFDLFNEPYGISWGCWLHGCLVPAGGDLPAYRSAGMQQLVDAVRSTGATQPLMLGGLGYAGDLSGWLSHEPHDPLGQLVASEHNYGGLSPCASACRAAVLSTHRRVPVVFGELGETDCQHSYIDAMMKFADAHGIGYLGGAWDATSDGWSCTGGPSLITRYNGTPTPYGSGLRDHLRALASSR